MSTAGIGVAVPQVTALETPSHTGASRAAWLAAGRYCAVVLVSVKAGLSLVGLLATGLLPRGTTVGVPGWPVTQPSAGWHFLFTAYERQDALWYLRIASQGYRPDDNSAAFFPLYPVLVHGVGWLLGDRWLLSAYVVSGLALLAGLMVLYRLTATELSETAARRTVLYVCLFPTGFFLFAPYTEALFLALSVGCLYAARRRRWALAGLLAAAAALTRSQGVLLAVPLAVEAVLQLRTTGDPLRLRLVRASGALAASGAALAGLGAFLLFWDLRYGDWRRPFDVQKSGWGKVASSPLHTLVRGYEEGTKYFGVYAGGYHTVDLILVALALAGGAWLTVRVRSSFAVYYWVSLTFPTFLLFDGRPLMSMPRFLSVLFPLAWALAAFAERWKAHDAVVATSAVGLGILATLFVDWYPMF